MCNPGWDGDMYREDTSSGKSVNSKPYYSRAKDGYVYKVEPLTIQNIVEKPKGKLRNKLSNLLRKIADRL
jgi:hypothetical protein